MRQTLKERFDAKWTLDSETGCWIWIASVAKDGYGKIASETGKTVSAHRASYMLYVGPIPTGLQVLHRPNCSKLCVNPLHLRIGTQRDNEADKLETGTRVSKLTDEIVRECRRRYLTGEASYRQLAEEFGITDPAMYDAINRITWKHVT